MIFWISAKKLDGPLPKVVLRSIDNADERVCSTRDALCFYTLACDFQKRSRSSHSSFQTFVRE